MVMGKHPSVLEACELCGLPGAREAFAAHIADASGGARIANASLSDRSHICAFFACPEDEYEIMLPFIKEGLERGEKSFQTIDPERLQDHLRRMTDANVDVEGYRHTNQLELRTWDEVYLPSGTFMPEDTAAVYSEVQDHAASDGYRRIRFIGHMEWVTQHLDKIDDLLINEARWNAMQDQMLPNHVVCMYDIRRYRPDVVVDVLRTHPQVIVGRTVYDNPFFVPPLEFIREIEGRTNTLTLKHRG